jgi:hypothetical protein
MHLGEQLGWASAILSALSEVMTARQLLQGRRFRSADLQIGGSARLWDLPHMVCNNPTGALIEPLF